MLARIRDVAVSVQFDRRCREVGWARGQSHGCEDEAEPSSSTWSDTEGENVLFFVLFSVHTSAALSQEQDAL